MAGAIYEIYTQLATVLGGTDPNQFLTLTIPGTILNQSDYAFDTTKSKPATVAQAESLLVDEMFDLAQVSGSSNGERVSDQYLQALSVLVPTFDPAMPLVKQKIRDYLRSPAPADATIGGVPFTGTLGEYYFALVEAWLVVKSAWEKEVIPARDSMTKEAFLEWYEERAETRLAVIDAAYGRLLSVFSPSDMNALLGALASGPDGAIEEAVTEVLDLRLPSPDGGYIYPVELIPSDWFLDLASDEEPANLLQDPQFIALTITARRQAISSSIGQIQTLLSQVPSGSDLSAAAAALATAQSNYTDAQTALLKTYTANTVTAIEIYMSTESGGLSVDSLNQDVAAVSKAANDPTPDTVAKTIAGGEFGVNDLKNLMAGQNTLITAQATLLASAQGLANAGMNLASAQSQTFGALPVMLARLQSQLSDVQAMEAQLAAAIAAASQRSLNAPPAVVDPRVVGAAGDVGTAASAAGPDAVSVLAATWTAISKADPSLNTQLYPIYGAANAAWASSVGPAITAGADRLRALGADLVNAGATAAKPKSATVASVQKAVTDLLPTTGATPEQVALAYIGTAANAATTIEDVNAAVSKDVDALTSVLSTVAGLVGSTPTAAATTAWPSTAPAAGSLDPLTAATVAACSTANATVGAYFGVAGSSSTAASGAGGFASTSQAAFTMTQQAVASAVAAFAPVAAPSAKSALSSDRWMELQFSFSSDQMTSSSQEKSLASQTSWSVDLFLGSASGSSQTSSASNAQSMLSADTSVQIGMKATKVVINRPWFNPGLFKLTGGMNRLSTTPISQGSTAVVASNQDNLKAYNEGLLPCFPVAFLVVKDVTIQFQAELSQMDAVHTVLDSRSAVGGGFLCFSASSSTAAHQDSNAVSSHTQDTVVSISMPGPQILGWFLEFTPPDGSQVMSPTAPTSGNDLNILQFIDALELIAEQENKVPVIPPVTG